MRGAMIPILCRLPPSVITIQPSVASCDVLHYKSPPHGTYSLLVPSPFLSQCKQVALIFAQPRGATVKAVGQLQLLSLDRRTFKRVMGPMENILQRNMKSYKRIAASNI